MSKKNLKMIDAKRIQVGPSSIINSFLFVIRTEITVIAILYLPLGNIKPESNLNLNQNLIQSHL